MPHDVIIVVFIIIIKINKTKRVKSKSTSNDKSYQAPEFSQIKHNHKLKKTLKSVGLCYHISHNLKEINVLSFNQFKNHLTISPKP